MARRENVKAVARAWMQALIEAGSTRDQAGAELVALARSLAADGETEAASVIAEVSRQPEVRDAAPPPEPGDEAILVKISELAAAGISAAPCEGSPPASIPSGSVRPAPQEGWGLPAEGSSMPQPNRKPGASRGLGTKAG